jgi:hypothetical protein
VRRPTWQDFTERPVADFELGSPAEEVAGLLRQHRSALDAAARAAADGRAQGLRALAEQAVLAVQLEKRLAREPCASDALIGLKDAMLDQIAGAGLEVVRLEGVEGRAVAGLVQVESWRYDPDLDDELVVEELEVAVCHLGMPLRLGRVVMGAPPDAGPRAGGEELARPVAAADAVAALRPSAAASTDPAVVLCPVTDCRAENAIDADVCDRCLTPLAAFRRLTQFPLVLFNRGLRAARDQQLRAARDCFAAALLWEPLGADAGNAFALACLELDDLPAARRTWQDLLARDPADAIARRGLAASTAS